MPYLITKQKKTDLLNLVREGKPDIVGLTPEEVFGIVFTPTFILEVTMAMSHLANVPDNAALFGADFKKMVQKHLVPVFDKGEAELQNLQEIVNG